MSSNYFVLAATGGFTVLHAAQIQPKNTSSALIANILSIAIATIVYWGCGFAFAIGDETLGRNEFFLSHTRFFLIDATKDDYTKFAEQVLILGLVIVIVNTGFIARMRCWLYPIIVIIISGLVYPCAHHWVYHPEGWLKNGVSVLIDTVQERLQFADVFGSSTIHVFAGSCSLIGTVILGRRRDRKDKRFSPVGGNVNPLIVLGGMLAIVGLIAKNHTEQLGLINNLLGAYGSAVIAFLFKRIKNCGDTAGTKALINGALAGVVGVSCAPDHYHPYGGFVIGVVAGLGYVMWSKLLSMGRIDDPTDSAAVHLGAGFWAALAGPIFRKDTGIIYEKGTNLSFQVFGWQMLGALAVFVWAGITVSIIILPFMVAKCATYKDAAYLEGLDALEHDDPAFPDRNSYAQDNDPWSSFDDIIPIKGSFKIGSYDNAALHAEVDGQPEFYGKVEAGT